jgi:nitrite reductase/ring-hydroxylating ferredoxin subunit
MSEPIWIRVFEAADSQPNHAFAMRVQEKDIAIFRTGETFVVMDRWCPHLNGDLAAGCLMGRAVKCPLHGFMFSVETGRGLNCPGFNVKVYDVRVDEYGLSILMATQG